MDIQNVTEKTVLVRTTSGFRVRHYDDHGECDMESGLIQSGRRVDGTLELIVARKVSKGDPRLWRFEVEPDYRFGLTEIVLFTSNFGVDLYGSRVI